MYKTDFIEELMADDCPLDMSSVIGGTLLKRTLSKLADEHLSGGYEGVLSLLCREMPDDMGYFRGALIIKSTKERANMARSLGASEDFINGLFYKEIRSIRKHIGLRTSEFV
jgi:hypothetical protein